MRALGALAVLPMLPAPLAAASRARPAFPSATLVLERTLDRHLADNALIRVTRCWSCTFQALGAGAVVDASQISAKVDAPPSLAAFARMEEARDASAIFPVQLDRSGLIVGWDEETGPDIGTAVARAMDVIEAAVANPGERQEARSFISSIGNAASGLVSQVPRDLFYPATGQSVETQPVTLAGGLQGSFEVAIAASADPQTGLLRQSERRVTTRIGDSSCETREAWRIVPEG